MGMDVYGKKPKSEAGEYFRNNVWWWHPLWSYCQDIAPALTSDFSGHTNDGEGLDGKDSLALADLLQREIDSGRTMLYSELRKAELSALPKEKCGICAGTGKRQSPPVVGAGDTPCNGCGSTGWREPFAKSYGFNVENVQEFVLFLRDCGGFEIC